MKRFPDEASRVKNWPTVQEVQDDKTHMLKFACKHRVLPHMIQFFDNEDRDQEIKQSTVPKLPKKINEQKIISANRGKSAAA
jgi:hypothetical protein